MILPTVRLYVLFVLGSLLWLVNGHAAMLCLAAVFGLLLLDICLLPNKKSFSYERNIQGSFYLLQPEEVQATLHNKSRQHVYGLLYDDLPSELLLASRQADIRMDPYSSFVLHWSVLPIKRGNITFGSTLFRLQSLLGLVTKELCWKHDKPSKVYPALAVGNQSILLTNDMQQAHSKSSSFHGVGEFNCLQRYMDGDDSRSIYWKASAKRGNLVSRKLQQEHGCCLMTLIDCGRQMAEKFGPLSRLDLAINASVLLCRTAIEKNDSFGLAAFSNKIEAIVPIKAKPSLKEVLDSVYTLKAQTFESNYWQIMGTALQGLSKRSLVVIFSNVLDSWASQGLLSNVLSAADKHVVVCVILQDKILKQAAAFETEYKQGAAAHLLLEREIALENMRRKGVYVLETEPASFSHDVLQKYIDLRMKA